MKLFNIMKKDASYDTYSIDPKKGLDEQVYELKEDLIQYKKMIEGKTFTVDIGWYPEFDINGSLKLYLIENCDWSKPLIEIKINYKDIENEIENVLKNTVLSKNMS